MKPSTIRFLNTTVTGSEEMLQGVLRFRIAWKKMAVLRTDCLKIIFLHAIFLLTLKTMHNSIFVNGDGTLIGRVCSKTLFPVECHNCFDPNPSSSQVGVGGLAGIAINCSFSQVVNVDELLINYPREPQYEFCQQQFDYIALKLVSAMQSWKNNRYQDAKNLVQLAIGDYFECLKSLDKPRYPDPFIDGLYKTRTSCENSVGVLSQIGS
ncbi:hypothetical protein Vadar_010991 [Vaccinium darrowii]|uniref:Uncharacterized protein n=1 Tax=Vaccinium darrowii TaxID=229202 RepID=A0ACB7Z3W3_9ERIC|nr:hypothetical protein Vadar_010991 [Vaccinium darrowii]